MHFFIMTEFLEDGGKILNKALYSSRNCEKSHLNVLFMWVRIFAEEFKVSGLTWLSFMKKKLELSRNSYLVSELYVCLIELVVVKTFNGFFIFILIKYFHNLE